tara:strand:- start:14809 stop:18018 length:3210 start_codon:yes stop_codon:yes gene_type:complete
MLLFFSGWINEWRLYLRHPSVWLSFIIYAGFGILLAQGLSVDGDVLTKRLVLLNNAAMMLTLPIIVGLLTPALLQRDTLSHMHPLIAVTPTSAKQQFILRGGAFFSLLCLLTLLCIVGQILMISPSASQSSSLLQSALKSTLFLYCPILVLFTALALACARYFNNALPSYVVMCAMWAGYVMLASINGSPLLAGSRVLSPQWYALMSWLDPYGFTAVYQQLEQNTDWSLTFKILLNRGLWLAVAAGIFYIARSAFDAESRNPTRVLLKSKTVKRLNWTVTFLSGCVRKNSVLRHLFSRRDIGLALFPQTLRSLTLSTTLTLVYVIYACMVFSEVLSGIGYAEPFSQLKTITSMDALARVVWNLMPFVGFILMSIWAWILCWKDKRYHMVELVAATPTGSRHLITAQCFSLTLMWGVFLGVTAIATMTAQLWCNSPLSYETYAETLLLTGLPLLLFGLLCLVVHHLSPNPLIGGLICGLMIVIKFSPIMSMVGIPHPLWDIAGTPLQVAKLPVGFQMSQSAFLPFFSYWALLTTLLLFLAIRKSHRGTGYTHLFSRGHFPLKVAVCAMLFSGTFILHSALKDERALMMPSERHHVKAAYEKRYLHWKDKAQPVVTHIQANVRFYPLRGIADIALSLTLTNHSNSRIDKILVGAHPDFTPENIDVEGATLNHYDVYTQQREFDLVNPLLPGQSKQLNVALQVANKNLWTSPTHHVIRKPFSYLRGVPLIPSIGFNRYFTLTDSSLREEAGLPALQYPIASALTASNAEISAEAQTVMVTSQLTAPVGYFTLAPGEKRKQWTEQDGDEHTMTTLYATREPIRAIPAWIATEFTHAHEPAVLADKSVEVNLIAADNEEAKDVHLRAATQTLAWFEQHIAPYPYAQLTFVFAPDLGPSGYALPQVLIFDHLLAMRTTPMEDGFDQRYRRAVHEVAHQWFGHQIGFGLPADSAFLVESLAKYVELVMLEPRGTMNKLVEYEARRYAHYQQGNTTPPVAFINGTETADVYSRATLVFAELRQLVGDKPITDTIRALFERQKSKGKPVAAIDFVRLLLARTNRVHHKRIQQLFLEES